MAPHYPHWIARVQTRVCLPVDSHLDLWDQPARRHLSKDIVHANEMLTIEHPHKHRWWKGPEQTDNPLATYDLLRLATDYPISMGGLLRFCCISFLPLDHTVYLRKRPNPWVEKGFQQVSLWNHPHFRCLYK